MEASSTQKNLGSLPLIRLASEAWASHSRVILKKLVSRNELLYDHTGDTDHGKAAIVDLFGLHLGKLAGTCWLKAQRVEAKVTRNVVRADCPRLITRRILEGEDGKDLDDGDGHDYNRPEGLERGLLERDVARRVVSGE